MKNIKKYIKKKLSKLYRGIYWIYVYVSCKRTQNIRDSRRKHKSFVYIINGL
uniref:Uncharacterized protein n=1 Tax=Anguilla anguilla TaxID=7936 RepID=A0A0E9XE45_ANGAN